MDLHSSEGNEYYVTTLQEYLIIFSKPMGIELQINSAFDLIGHKVSSLALLVRLPGLGASGFLLVEVSYGLFN